MTQNETILNALLEHKGSFVAMPDLAMRAGCFAVHSRVADLRKLGHTITNRVENRNGTRYSWYRLEG